MKCLLMACLLLPLSAQAFCLGEVSNQRTNSLGDTNTAITAGSYWGLLAKTDWEKLNIVTIADAWLALHVKTV